MRETGPRAGAASDSEYEALVGDLLRSEAVRQMRRYPQHGGVSCLGHCTLVSYYSYRFCRARGWDYRSAARGGLLHDLFLYDWHLPHPGGPHAFTHPRCALHNAERLFALNARERDIILHHMWPVTLSPPRSREAWVVSVMDKLCALEETMGPRRFLWPCRRFDGA